MQFTIVSTLIVQPDLWLFLQDIILFIKMTCLNNYLDLFHKNITITSLIYSIRTRKSKNSITSLFISQTNNLNGAYFKKRYIMCKFLRVI